MLWRRWVVFAVLATVLFVAALSNDVYNLTSPPAFSFHVLMRKIYSIVAFTAVGAAFTWASGASVARCAGVIAAYSGAIEVGQHFTYGREPFVWNLVDVVCGAIGGALAPLIPRVRAK